jgi:hypothetical protein
VPGDAPPILLEERLYALLKTVDAPPVDVGTEAHLEFLAEIQALSRAAGAELEGFLENEEFFIPETVRLSVGEASADGVDISAELNLDETPPLPDDVLRGRRLPRVYWDRARTGPRRRVITSKIRDRVERINARSRIVGSDVPRFIENPEAFLPPGVDLGNFSKRVKGLRNLVYNSRPYLHVKRLEGGWFEGVPGIRLEAESDGEDERAMAPPHAPLPGAQHPTLSPDTYRRLAARTGQEYVRHGDVWVRIDVKQAEQFIDRVDKLRGAESEDSGQLRIPIRAILDIYKNLESLEFELPPADVLNVHFAIADLPAPTMSKRFTGELKPHQQDGYRWLAYLDQKGAGGLLADDMGLGKTVQVIAHMARLADEGRLRPSLVVCPKTLIENWAAEIHRFVPSQRGICVAQGARVFAEELGKFDIVLVSYDQLRHQQFEIAKVDWQLVVSDEAQFAKNPTAQRTTALKALKSRHRAALTGTPVENGMIEFWCIMDFVRPGLLGSWSDFRTEYERPLVEAETDDARNPLILQLLGNIGRHYLRRMKQDVLKDLPRRSETILSTPLSTRQLRLYRQIAEQGRANVKGAALSAIHNLLLLSAHPFALGSYDDFAYVEGDCPKLDATLQELKRIREQGEKAIVFTRFLRVQSILQAAIRQELNVWPDIVNGAINTNRQRIVDVFSAKPGFDVLILSHDVGGVGLNITAANHVIHYTRPWNPAKENQATDRAHRIGQDREVTVYYPVAVGNGFESVEERLGRLLSAKSALARDVLRPSRDMEVRAEEMFSCVEDVPAGGDEAPESTRDAE